MSVARFRKKPIIIEAIRLPAAGKDASEEFKAELHAFLSDAQWESGRHESLIIETPEGNMRADAGDWIIRGVKGEFYPCKPDIFDLTYEPA